MIYRKLVSTPNPILRKGGSMRLLAAVILFGFVYVGIAAPLSEAPLWGVRMRPRLMHEAASLTFRDAILRHRGEASEERRDFERLGASDQQALIQFLNSL